MQHATTMYVWPINSKVIDVLLCDLRAFIPLQQPGSATMPFENSSLCTSRARSAEVHIYIHPKCVWFVGFYRICHNMFKSMSLAGLCEVIFCQVIEVGGSHKT